MQSNEVMERPLKALLVFFAVFPLLGGIAAAIPLLLGGFVNPTSWLFALVAIPSAYALAYGAAALAGLLFALFVLVASSTSPRSNYVGIGAVSGAFAVLVDMHGSEGWLSYGLPLLGAASGAICGFLVARLSAANRTMRELLSTPRGITMTLCATAVLCVLGWRVLVVHAGA